jgi:hypothetical protein
VPGTRKRGGVCGFYRVRRVRPGPAWAAWCRHRPGSLSRLRRGRRLPSAPRRPTPPPSPLSVTKPSSLSRHAATGRPLVLPCFSQTGRRPCWPLAPAAVVLADQIHQGRASVPEIMRRSERLKNALAAIPEPPTAGWSGHPGPCREDRVKVSASLPKNCPSWVSGVRRRQRGPSILLG